jgi:hypothetical protein
MIEAQWVGSIGEMKFGEVSKKKINLFCHPILPNLSGCPTLTDRPVSPHIVRWTGGAVWKFKELIRIWESSSSLSFKGHLIFFEKRLEKAIDDSSDCGGISATGLIILNRDLQHNFVLNHPSIPRNAGTYFSPSNRPNVL